MIFKGRKLSGEEVGRQVLQDLAAVHINVRRARLGQELLPAMDPADKAALVNSLTEPADIAAYNDFRYFHEFLSRAALYFNVHQQNADASYWEIIARLELLRLAEAENYGMLLEMPQIMTRSQYERARNLFSPAGALDFGRGVALVETEGFPEGVYPLNRQGKFLYPVPDGRRIRLAEHFLRDGQEFAATVASYRAALKEALVIKAAFEIFAKFLDVAELADMLREPDLEQVRVVNEIMADTPGMIVRRGLDPDERPEAELRAELAELLRPISLKNLRPSARLKAQAARALDFSVARGNSEKIYEILRREAES